MKKRKKLSFAELVKENKLQLQCNLVEMEKIEIRVEEKYVNKSY